MELKRCVSIVLQSLRTIQELKRMKTSRSPLLSHTAAAAQGPGVIHAYDRKDYQPIRQIQLDVLCFVLALI